MMTTVVRHDGMEMPLDTFIDAYRMVRVDPYRLPNIDSAARLIAVDACGRVADGVHANSVDWHSIAAFRLLDGIPEAEPCFDCGTSPDESDVCESCADMDAWYQ